MSQSICNDCDLQIQHAAVLDDRALLLRELRWLRAEVALARLSIVNPRV